jgi:hypothetical protein
LSGRGEMKPRRRKRPAGPNQVEIGPDSEMDRIV